jgi:hypothetical protein
MLLNRNLEGVMINQDIKNLIENFECDIEKHRTENHGRFLSWNHCYSAFAQYKGQTSIPDECLDYLCLHLAFYLASWGMYRGSSKLLQKDYKVHGTTVALLMQDTYKDLWSIKCEEFLSNDIKLGKLFLLCNELKRIYQEFGVTPTDTLITKILMGTFGCIPAYDRYFKIGVKGRVTTSLPFNEKSIRELSRYYVDNIDNFEKLRKELSKDSIDCPQMKVLDLCFVLMGYKIEENK